MKPIDLAGRKFGRLTVISRAGTIKVGSGRQSTPTWNCQCDCGAVKIISGRVLRRTIGPTVSCGCKRGEGGFQPTHGLSGTLAHKTWIGMIQRCTLASSNNFPRYGGSGIGVCARWRESFSAFLEDMGQRPSPLHSIDRIDNSKGYEPGNCRWATDVDQANNMRSNVRIEYEGVTRTLSEWCKILRLPYHTIKKRYQLLRWTAHRAFTEPIQTGRRRVRANHP